MDMPVTVQTDQFFCASRVVLGFKCKSKLKWVFPPLFVALSKLFS